MPRTAEIIAVGSELLTGGVTNTNARLLSELLTASGVDVLTKEQFRELADQRMNAASDTTHEESTLMSYVDPADGRTYYSFDGAADGRGI